MLHLRDKDKEALEAIAKRCFPVPVEIWAYGSRVNGESHDASDLDLVVRTADLKPLPPGLLWDFKEALQESNIPILVQVFDWARLPESFHANILEGYAVVVPI